MSKEVIELKALQAETIRVEAEYNLAIQIKEIEISVKDEAIEALQRKIIDLKQQLLSSESRGQELVYEVNALSALNKELTQE